MYHLKRRLILPTIWRDFSRSVTTVKNSLTMNDIPRPRSLPIIGSKLALIAAGSGARLHEYIDKRHKQLGHIFCENLSGADIVFISDPELMKLLFIKLEGKYPAHILPEPWVLYEKMYGSKRGLFFMNGEEWLYHRKTMNKLLLREDSENWLREPIRETIMKFIENWRLKVKSGVTPKIESELYRLSIDVIVAILFGPKSSVTPSRHNEELLCMFSETVKKIFHTTTNLYSLPVTLCATLNLKVWRDFKESVDESLFLAQKLVNEILSLDSVGKGLIKKLTNENISKENITRVVADLIIAAGDTTSYTLLWTLYLLSNNQEYLRELRNNEESYVKYVIKESMRLYPVAPFLTRILPESCVMGPYKLRKSTPVVASIYTSGRNSAYFSEAEKFLPYRWNRNDVRKANLPNHVPSATIPFAFGSRSCIGKKIAMLQLTEFISEVVKNFDITSEMTDVSPVMSQVLVPNKPITLSFSINK